MHGTGAYRDTTLIVTHNPADRVWWWNGPRTKLYPPLVITIAFAVHGTGASRDTTPDIKYRPADLLWWWSAPRTVLCSPRTLVNIIAFCAHGTVTPYLI